MDMRTGVIYNSLEEARAAGVEEENLLKVRNSLVESLDEVEHRKAVEKRLLSKFRGPFASIKNQAHEKV